MHVSRLSIPEETSPQCIFASRGATVVCVVSGYGGVVGGGRPTQGVDISVEHQTGDVIR